eukprot:6331866-Prymnesium_polylepis.2
MERAWEGVIEQALLSLRVMLLVVKARCKFSMIPTPPPMQVSAPDGRPEVNRAGLDAVRRFSSADSGSTLDRRWRSHNVQGADPRGSGLWSPSKTSARSAA